VEVSGFERTGYTVSSRQGTQVQAWGTGYMVSKVPRSTWLRGYGYIVSRIPGTGYVVPHYQSDCVIILPVTSLSWLSILVCFSQESKPTDDG